ncbi:MAG: ABC transporter ATP-binding protein [Elusimicrobia bacterium]|nr:ABC transporter ATP-binding protein [Elusimicrobiota bacterium]
MAEVRVENIRKSFGAGRPVLEGVSFSVADGEFVSLLGPSGCGKTTLLRIIAGLEYAYSGRLSIGGREVSDVPPKDRDIAFVFQNYALYPHLTVEENVAMGLKLRGVPAPEIARRTADAAARLGLEPLLKRRPAALSGGQRQRVALARSLVREPRVFLLDEPLSNLDAVLRERTRGELKLLFKRAKGTVVYVTHDQVEAMTMSDRVVLLHEGKIQQVGTPEDLYRRPASVFAATFLGAPPMNIVPRADAERSGLFPDLPEGDLLVGVRPEELKVGEGREAAIVVVEPVGSYTILTLDAGGAAPRAARPRTRSGGATCRVAAPSGAMHLFDAADGGRLPNP